MKMNNFWYFEGEIQDVVNPIIDTYYYSNYNNAPTSSLSKIFFINQLVTELKSFGNDIFLPITAFQSTFNNMYIVHTQIVKRRTKSEFSITNQYYFEESTTLSPAFSLICKHSLKYRNLTENQHMSFNTECMIICKQAGTAKIVEIEYRNDK